MALDSNQYEEEEYSATLSGAALLRLLRLTLNYRGYLAGYVVGVIGMVLAEMIERNLHISLGLYGEFFLFTRPITAAMLAFIVVTTALPFVRRYRRSRAAAAGDGS